MGILMKSLQAGFEVKSMKNTSFDFQILFLYKCVERSIANSTNYGFLILYIEFINT